MEVPIKQTGGSDSNNKHTSIPSSNISILTDVHTSSLAMVLEATSRNIRGENPDGGPSSLQVHRDWMLSNLEGADEAIELPNDDVMQESEISEGKGGKAIDAQYTDDKSKDKVPSQLIKGVMVDIQKEFKSPYGSEFKAHGLGVGRKLSKLLEEINQEDAAKNATGEPWTYERDSDQESPIRDKTEDGVNESGQPAP
ncbi:unnamed protein product [Rhizoctonia solani]|nr:unnamed protein product [Rhizoctonia solani]